MHHPTPMGMADRVTNLAEQLNPLTKGESSLFDVFVQGQPLDPGHDKISVTIDLPVRANGDDIGVAQTGQRFDLPGEALVASFVERRVVEDLDGNFFLTGFVGAAINPGLSALDVARADVESGNLQLIWQFLVRPPSGSHVRPGGVTAERTLDALGDLLVQLEALPHVVAQGTRGDVTQD